MDRDNRRASRHEISCKVAELQDILAASHQLERFPDCKVKEALKVEIELYLNPPDDDLRRAKANDEFSSCRRVVEGSSTEKSSSTKVDYDFDWSPKKMKSSWPILLTKIFFGVIGVILLVSILRQIL